MTSRRTPPADLQKSSEQGDLQKSSEEADLQKRPLEKEQEDKVEEPPAQAQAKKRRVDAPAALSNGLGAFFKEVGDAPIDPNDSNDFEAMLKSAMEVATPKVGDHNGGQT